MSNAPTRFEPDAPGPLTLSNGVVLAPLTRNRAGAGFVQGKFVALYYSQRGSAGLLISEVTQISQQGHGDQDAPGSYTQAQIDGWGQVTEAVARSIGSAVLAEALHCGLAAQCAVLIAAPAYYERYTRGFATAAGLNAEAPMRC